MSKLLLPVDLNHYPPNSQIRFPHTELTLILKWHKLELLPLKVSQNLNCYTASVSNNIMAPHRPMYTSTLTYRHRSIAAGLIYITCSIIWLSTLKEFDAHLLHCYRKPIDRTLVWRVTCNTIQIYRSRPACIPCARWSVRSIGLYSYTFNTPICILIVNTSYTHLRRVGADYNDDELWLGQSSDSLPGYSFVSWPICVLEQHED